MIATYSDLNSWMLYICEVKIFRTIRNMSSWSKKQVHQKLSQISSPAKKMLIFLVDKDWINIIFCKKNIIYVLIDACIIFIQIFWSSSLHKLWNYLTLRFLSQATSRGLMSHSPSYVSNMDLLQYRFSELITGSNGHKLYRNVIKTSFKFWKRVCLCKIYIVFL